MLPPVVVMASTRTRVDVTRLDRQEFAQQLFGNLQLAQSLRQPAEIVSDIVLLLVGFVAGMKSIKKRRKKS